MNTENENNIEALESKVDELLALSKKLAEENAALKSQMSEIRSNRAHLVEQKEQVRSQVESMIARLRVIETA